MTDSARPNKSAGLGGTVFEFPVAMTRHSSQAATEVSRVRSLDLLQYLPDCTFKRYVIDVAKMTKIPQNTSLLVGLGVVSSVSCRVAGVAFERGDVQPTGIYVLTAQPPGTGKSWLLSTFQLPIFDASETAFRLWKERKTAAEAAGQEFDEAAPLFNFDTEATPEGLDPTLADSNGFFALASAEQGLANSIMGVSYSEGRKNNNDLWLKGFNGEYHSSKRATRKGYRGRVVGAVTCFAQESVISTILTSTGDSGAAERCFLLAEPSFLGKRKHGREYRHYPNEFDQNTYNRIVSSLTQQAMASAEVFRQLPAYRLSEAAWTKIYALKDELEPHLAEGGKYSLKLLQGMVSKVDIQIMKLAANFAILDERPVGEIPDKWVDAAIGMMREYLEYILGLLVELDVIGTNALEDSVIAYLGQKGQATRSQFQSAKTKIKPWSEITPKSAIARTMRQTIDELIGKGIVAESETFEANGKSQGKILRLIA